MRAITRFLVLLFVVDLACVGISRAQVGADGVKSQSLTFQRVGGITSADSVGRLLKMDASGNAKVVDADRDRDKSVFTPLLQSGIGARSIATTDVMPATEYTSFQIHMEWTVGATLADTTKRDSVAFLLIPFARTTLLDDGRNILISTPSVVGASGVDSTIGQLRRTYPGILVTTRDGIWGGTISPLTGGYRPAQIVWADLGATNALWSTNYTAMRSLDKTWHLTHRVSFPLGNAALGAPIKEKYFGFYVLNLSQTIVASNVIIDVVPKAN